MNKQKRSSRFSRTEESLAKMFSPNFRFKVRVAIVLDVEHDHDAFVRSVDQSEVFKTRHHSAH